MKAAPQPKERNELYQDTWIENSQTFLKIKYYNILNTVKVDKYNCVSIPLLNLLQHT